MLRRWGVWLNQPLWVRKAPPSPGNAEPAQHPSFVNTSPPDLENMPGLGADLQGLRYLSPNGEKLTHSQELEHPGPFGTPPPITASAPTNHSLHHHGPYVIASASIVGTRHQEQQKPCEDSVGICHHGEGLLAVAVADGVSGGALGDWASHSAVAYLTAAHPQVQDADAFAQHLRQADAHVQHALAKRSPMPGACTAAAVWLQPNGQAQVHHVGDVRAYLCGQLAQPGEPMVQLTQDHTYRNLALAAVPGISPDNPACMLGNLSAPTPQPTSFQLHPGQTLLLCTDGLHGVADDAQIAQTLAAHTNPLQAAHALLQLALSLGSDDDIAVLLLSHHTRHPQA